MRGRSTITFATIHTEGAILPPDLLQRIASSFTGTVAFEGLAAGDYHLDSGERLNEAISRAWNRLLPLWSRFRASMADLSSGDPATTMTRERWLLPLFDELGYGRLLTARALELDGRSYAISHGWGHVPLHLVGCAISLDTRTAGVAGASRASPHGLVQDALNRSDDHLWALLSNGLRLRILRDNASLTRQAYVEFDLEAMFEGQVYADFCLLWILCHQSRFEGEPPERCWLERWSQQAQEQGLRVRERLREGVQRAIEALGSGFLAHAANIALREKLFEGHVSPRKYYRQLLRLVYRLMVLLVAEARDLLLDPQAAPEARTRYEQYYSVAHLRRLAERHTGTRHGDLYETLRLVMHLLGERAEPTLGLRPLGSFLFSPAALPDLEGCALSNEHLLDAIRALGFIDERSVRRVVDYRSLDTEELGGIYESLLELHPTINTDAAAFSLQYTAGNDRKSSGSYYTPRQLVQALLDSALEPVLDEACRGRKGEDAANALLQLSVVDPACGSGHFLIGAANRIAKRVAMLRSGDDEPSPEALRVARREVIARCLYGVDINPLAVDLCKVSLWIESLDPGKPLSFLDHHIRHGNSLIGAWSHLVEAGIPDEAYAPLGGDDKTIASTIRKRNKEARQRLEDGVQQNALDLGLRPINRAAQFDMIPALIETLDQQRTAESSYLAYEQDTALNQEQYHLWTAAFFIPRTAAQQQHIPTTDDVLHGAPPERVEAACTIAHDLHFFHWELAFPTVFELGGFDVVLGNPPWEQQQFEEREYWFDVPEIRDAATKAARERAIQSWRQGTDVQRLKVQAFDVAKYSVEAASRFTHASGRYPLTAVGRLNSYALFAELNRRLLRPSGHAGMITPSGIATDNTTRVFFANLIERGDLVSLFDFENREKLFSDVDSRMKFCLLTLGQITAPMEFIFFATRTEHLRDPKRRITLTAADIEIINPNTRTSPIFRTSVDADLTKYLYSQAPVLLRTSGDEVNVDVEVANALESDSSIDQTIEDSSLVSETNPWGVAFKQGLFNMSTASGLFSMSPGEGLVPLYEAKLMHQFTHRWASYEGKEVRELTPTELADPNCQITPRYWVPADEVKRRLEGKWEREWLLGFRLITNATNERTLICSFLPFAGAGNSVCGILSETTASLASCLMATLCSMVVDYILRQKVGGTNLNFFIMNQITVLPPSAFETEDIAFIGPRVVELVYTAWDMQSFARDVWQEADDETKAEIMRRNAECNVIAPPDLFSPRNGFPLPPFCWNEERRALIRAELDARIARLYGLSRDQLCYILDPQDVYGPDFPGETFRGLKEKEMRRYGEYRTRRLVLEAWDREAE